MSDSEKEMPSPGKEITAEESDKQDVKDTDNTEKASPKKDSPKKSPKKTPKKQKEESEDEDESEDEEEPKLGLLERPVVLESGKRERKKVERLSNEISSDTPKEKKLEIPEGKGDKLGDCARIEHLLTKTKADELKLLHRVLYGRIAPNSEVKKNIRKFCGFDFEKDSAEYAKKVTTINKLFLTPLKFLCNVVDVEKKGTKEDIVNRMMDFLMNPKDSGKPIPKSKRSKSKDKTKRKRKTKANSEKKEKKSKSPKKEVKSDENVSVSDSGSEVSDISDSEDEGSASDIEEPKAKKAKIESSKKENSPKKKPEPKKKAEVKKKEIKPKKEKKSLPPKKRKVAEDSDSDSDDEPLIAKKKSPPTNDQIKDVIKIFLDGANLEEVTMKTVLKQVYAEFPDFDLTERKDFIKSTVKQIIT